MPLTDKDKLSVKFPFQKPVYTLTGPNALERVINNDGALYLNYSRFANSLVRRPSAKWLPVNNGRYSDWDLRYIPEGKEREKKYIRIHQDLLIAVGFRD